jgi:hypothetical protein
MLPNIDPVFCMLLANSHLALVGKPLISPNMSPEQAARWLYEEAPFCVLAHNTEADPRFVYANRTAQRCFEYGWDEFTTLPSRLSAEAPEREERQRLLDMVARQGYSSDYRGVRIAKSGRRFWIENVTVWNLLDHTGEQHGQAAVFHHWRDI